VEAQRVFHNHGGHTFVEEKSIEITLEVNESINMLMLEDENDLTAINTAPRTKVRVSRTHASIAEGNSYQAYIRRKWKMYAKEVVRPDFVNAG
jgi:hypothetical protein